MSQDYIDAELFADFIIEAKEHLETIEPNLLELEKTPDNLSLLNDIFRPMHSMKGASGFMGLNRINQLAHRAENILDELRKGEMVVTSEIMDVILSATDALRQMIDNLEQTNTEGDVAIEPIVEQIDAIMSGDVSPTPLKVMKESVAEAESAVAVKKPSAKGNADDQDGGVGPQEWIVTLPHKSPYALTAFGEGHLKDFIEEAREITENLNIGLLELERNPDESSELVNDLFRFFHNLKGNSGIIGFQELNELTHEAETLLNRVRHGEMPSSHELIDLLLLVTDVMDALVASIDPASGQARPFDATALLAQLQQAVAGGAIELPAALRDSGGKAPTASAGSATSSAVPAAAAGSEDDMADFNATIKQQVEIIQIALGELRRDAAQPKYIDALYRALVSIQNAAKFMDFEDIRLYAERTAGLVDKARNSDMDFGLMVDLLRQEAAIISDMTVTAASAPRVEAKVEAALVVTPKVEAKLAAPAPAVPKVETKPAEVNTVAAPKVEARPAPVPAAPPATSASAPAASAASAAAQASKTDEHKASSTIRVDHEKLDHLMNLIGELIINRNRYTMIARQLEASGPDIDMSMVAQNLTETTYGMARISDDLQDTIMKVRMVPVSSVFSRFPRLVRDLSRKSGKEVELVLEGEETELDKSVVEVIGDPLVHLIRNSVDHGIEHEDVRIQRGKPVVGRVVLRAYHKGNSVAVEIEDDGQGLDPERLREVAVRKGLMTMEEARQLDDSEAKELIFAPGFSSAEQITDISGRGVGMDVVRTNIKNLKGSISISSEVGKGTRFTLSLPLTLAIIDALMINVSGETFAIPLDAVSETTKIETARLTDVKGRKAVTLRGEVLGLVQLAEMLNLPQPEQLPDVLSVVVIHDNERRLGLVVDRMQQRQEIVIKPLGAYLGDIKGISGATIMGDGSVILILDPHEIYLSATSNKGSMGAAN